MTVYGFDACALIAYFNQENGADNVESILLQENCSRLISMLNVYEVCYDAARVSGLAEGRKLYQDVQRLPLTIVYDIRENVMKEAMYFKISYRVSVADSIALGLAKVKDAALVTADHHEFDSIDHAHDLEFYWIR